MFKLNTLMRNCMKRVLQFEWKFSVFSLLTSLVGKQVQCVYFKRIFSKNYTFQLICT